MAENIEKAVEEILNCQDFKLSEREKRVLHSILKKETISRNLGIETSDDRTFGEKVADRIASFGGSWTFMFIFGGTLVFWVLLNSVILRQNAFDAYPYILLNLFLSMLAAIQAPIIMMSQNRQSVKDRESAAHDYEVNLKAELEIRRLHEKLDELREVQWLELVSMQQEQIKMLEDLVPSQKREL